MTNAKIFDLKAQRLIGQQQFIDDISSSELIVIGEYHDQKIHHDNQLVIIKNLSLNGPIDVGLEFIAWTHQNHVQDYLANHLSEEEFLKNINWGGNPFEFYRPLMWQAHHSLGQAYGINAPRSLSSRISRYGLNDLTPEERQLLPPDFTLGQERYFKRFKEIMTGGGHSLPDEKLLRYFQAQSLWDETMAYQSLKAMKPELGPFVIIVGSFHVEYKLGLPARLSARSSQSHITTVVQILSDRSEEEIEELKEHPEYGYIADYVIINEINP